MSTNRLSNKTSPYLKQHEHNPVDWYPWGNEALEKAKAEDKPLFLSVGYSSCHWCHVMAHESFEHDDVAAILNKHFVSIKVDREEHPDIDALYMTATHLMTGHGGWPNSVWLMPDGRPWYAGTYFPREDMPGRVGFKTLLNRLAEVWREKRSDVEQQAEQLTQAIRKQNDPQALRGEKPADLAALLGEAGQQFLSQYDEEHGGFGGAPKFPPHAGILFLLGMQKTSPDPEAGRVIDGTLDAMARGGICDQIGGGFHRYATDSRWLLPHFEKMLYDNASLLKAYARAYSHDPNPQYRRIVNETAAWLAREMTHPDGGFFAALDADSEGEEGKYYTWALNEVIDVLGKETATNFAATYQILPAGNFHDEATGRATGLNIPHLPANTGEDDIAELLDAREKLLTRRAERIPPGLDNKVITAWNGLMISALADAGRILEEPEYVARAEKARAFIEKNLVSGNKVMRSWCDGKAETTGVLEDYAALILADLDLHTATADKTYLANAVKRVAIMLENFSDPDTGDLYMTPNDHATSLLRVREVFDQGSPSGTGLAAQALVRVGIANGDSALLDFAARVIAGHQVIMERAPTGVSTLLEAARLLSLQNRDSDREEKPEVTITVPDSIELDENGAGTFELSFDLPEGWHINEASPLRVEVETEEVSAEIAARTSATQVAFEVMVKAGGRTPENLAGRIYYQVCTETMCLPPDTHQFRLKIKTVPRS